MSLFYSNPQGGCSGQCFSISNKSVHAVTCLRFGGFSSSNFCGIFCTRFGGFFSLIFSSRITKLEGFNVGQLFFTLMKKCKKENKANNKNVFF